MEGGSPLLHPGHSRAELAGELLLTPDVRLETDRADGSLLATKNEDGQIKVWNVDTGKEKATHKIGLR